MIFHQMLHVLASFSANRWKPALLLEEKMEAEKKRRKK